MSVILFIAILVVLILVHEIGHFVIAKRAGIRVDEFGLGYPPKVYGKKIGETTYTLNLLPFGGFVRIFGEDPDEDAVKGPDKSRSFVNKPKYIQVAVLAAGIIANIIFAWLLFSIGYMSGFPSSVGDGVGNVQNAELIIIDVMDGSPAENAGLLPGDVILSAEAQGDELAELSPVGVSEFIKGHQSDEITLELERNDEVLIKTLSPDDGVIEGQRAIGIAMDVVGILKLPVHEALIEGAKTTWEIAIAIVVGIAKLISDAVQGDSNLSQVAGPVGIAGMVGDASTLGFIYILTFTAFISLNLAIINLVPFPALDGGRILFVLIEAITRRPLSHAFTNTANTIGFVLLLGLMLVVTFNDILKLF